MLEGRNFIIYTDQKPLTYAFKQNPNKCSPRQLRHLDLISQYSTDIRHVQGFENTVADALSRIEIDSITKSPILNFKEFALAQKNDPDLQKFLQTDGSSLKLELKPYQTPDCDLLCDISTGAPRPFVPVSFRRALFNHLHNLSHPGIAASKKLICSRYVWPGMKCQIKKWVRCCESHIHIDIVGPLPPSEGHHYLLTIIDRFSRWREAIPIPDMQAKTIFRAIFDACISRFGCPSVITSDQGTQMRSSMNAEFTPHENDTWYEIVPIILLGIRTAVKEDLQSSCAEIVYGTNLRLPSDMIDMSNIPFCDNNFITNLCNRMQQLNPVATSAHCTDQYYIHSSLQSSSHIFLRINRVQSPLRQPYTGPHKVLSRIDKTITIDVNGRKTTVFFSLDRVKPAHLLSETVCESLPTVNKSIKDDKLSTNDKPIFTTKSGRHVHFPKKLAIYVT
ncbi:transposon Tf2-11 polyprotein [Trichonephila clavipes]|nr:transposon Tf2-11 polyprotein [Trichonephila clavipes]